MSASQPACSRHLYRGWEGPSAARTQQAGKLQGAVDLPHARVPFEQLLECGALGRIMQVPGPVQKQPCGPAKHQASGSGCSNGSLACGYHTGCSNVLAGQGHDAHRWRYMERCPYVSRWGAGWVIAGCWTMHEYTWRAQPASRMLEMRTRAALARRGDQRRCTAFMPASLSLPRRRGTLV